MAINAFVRRKINKQLTAGSNVSIEGYDPYNNGLIKGNRTLTKTDQMMNFLSSKWSAGANPLKSNNVRVFAMESDDMVTRADTDMALDELEADSAAARAQDGGEYSEAQIEAANMAAAAANEREAVLAAQQADVVPGAIQSADLGGEQSVGRRSMEAYDDSDNRNSMVISFTYNLKAARQDEFGEAFFPTVAVSPDTSNVTIISELLSVFEENKRNTDGTYEYEWNRKSLINALVYPDILNNDTSRCIPVYRDTDPKNIANFVDASKITPREVEVENTGYVIKTQPISIDADFDLLGLSSPDYLLEKGYLDFTDQLDQSVKLQNLYMETKSGEIIAFRNLDQIPESTFTYLIMGNNRGTQLKFHNRFMTIDSNTKLHDGKDSTLQAVTGGYTAQLNVKVNGDCNLNTGIISLSASPIKVNKLFNAQGEKIPTDTGVGKTVADELNGAKIIGYDVIARRINLNHRERGQLLDINQERLFYSMPILAPISIVRPTSESDSSDGARLDKLIQATYVRCSNAAVDALLNAEALMATIPEIKEPTLLYNNKTLGAARFFVTPYYKHITLDIQNELNTLTSSGRMSDVQAVLINTIREMVYRAYLESNYKSAASAMQGENGNVKPLVTLGTDPYIAAYLMVTGDLRNLGDEFDLRVVSTPNIKMRGKIIMTFGKGSKGSQDLSNPLHFGNMLWRPEVTSILPLTRNGQTSKEITVQPSFLHVIHCPIMMSINITNMADAVTKQVPVYTDVKINHIVNTKQIP